MQGTKHRTYNICLCGLFAALCAVLSWFPIPIAPVPVTLTHIPIFLAAGLLGPWYGALSVTVFVAMGAAGLPVFTGFSGGLGVVLGPRGGYILGYIATAFVTGLVRRRLGTKTPALVIAMLAGWACTYGLGVPWFMLSQKVTLAQAVIPCFVIFIPGDAVKTALCAALIGKLSRIYPSSIMP